MRIKADSPQVLASVPESIIISEAALSVFTCRHNVETELAAFGRIAHPDCEISLQYEVVYDANLARSGCGDVRL